MSRFSGYDEEMNINLFDDDGVYASGDKIKKYIPKMEDKDRENFVIVKSKLLYIGTDKLELEAAKRLGLGSNGDSSDSQAAIKELQAIISGVVELNDKFEDTSINENKDTKNGFIGTKLVKRESKSLLDGTWNIVIEYDKENKETARYGEGYYWLKKGETYKIGEEELLFKNDYVIDYKNKEYQILSGRAVNWNEKATLGVSENIALNLDPMSLADGEWVEINEKDKVNEENYKEFMTDSNGSKIETGIKKAGDVEYDKEIKALKFNESKENLSGEGGYLRLSKDGLDFSNGFTFEFYGNLSRGPYTNVKYNYNPRGWPQMGIFWRVDDPFSARFAQSMRFAPGSVGWFGDFCDNSAWIGRGLNMSTKDYGDIYAGNSWSGLGIDMNKDFYMTVVYRVFDQNKENQEDYDEFMKEKKNLDKIEYYLNGELKGYTYYAKSSYKIGLDFWNNDKCDFFIGMVGTSKTMNLFFLKGLNYSTRLYQIPLTSSQVKLNYDKTLKYRDSFKNE